MTSRLTVAFLCMALLGCGTVISPQRPNYQVDVVSVEQQAAEAVQASPTEFTVDFETDRHAWERAHIFFSEYTSGSKLTEQNSPIWRSQLQSAAANDKFLYEVSREVTPAGFRYSVSCTGLQDSQTAQRNARNLARFIKDGTLEVSLLVR